MGYRRENGRVGTRNYIGILTSVNCSATAARMIASAFGPEEMARYPNVDGVVAFVHGTGCGMASQGEGFEAWFREIRGCFTRVITRKPAASRQRSREVYVVASGFNGGE